jgi:hypothetical protein
MRVETSWLVNRLAWWPTLFVGAEGRRAAFANAIRAFASQLGTSLPPTLPELAPDDPVFGSALALHMAAFLVALGRSIGSLPETLAEVLQHERSYWRRLVDGVRLNEEEQGEVLEALEKAAVILTLLGGAPDEHSAREIAQRALPVEAAEARIRTLLILLSRLYGTVADEGRVFQGLEPDLLGRSWFVRTWRKHLPCFPRLWRLRPPRREDGSFSLS